MTIENDCARLLVFPSLKAAGMTSGKDKGERWGHGCRCNLWICLGSSSCAFFMEGSCHASGEGKGSFGAGQAVILGVWAEVAIFPKKNY